MRIHSLYPSIPEAPISRVSGLERNSACSRCELGADAETRCLSTEVLTSSGCLVGGDPSETLLVIGAGPSRVEDSTARIFRGSANMRIRNLVSKSWAGPVVLAYATRCYSGREEPSLRHIRACRPYLAQVISEHAPTRILALGAEAIYSLVGRSILLASTRRAYAWIALPDRRIPAFFMSSPDIASNNRMYQPLVDADVKWALESPVPIPPPWDGKFCEVETAEDAKNAVDAIRCEAPWCAYDLEWAGNPFDKYFEVICAAVAPPDIDSAYVWPRIALAKPDVREPLLQLLADESIRKCGLNLKGDNLSAFAAWGVDVKGADFDARLVRRLLEVDITASLEVSSELVGMGRHKDENDAALAQAEKRIGVAREQAKNSQQGNLFQEQLDPALVAAVERHWDDPKTFAYALVPVSILNRYCARDAVAHARLAVELRPRLAARPSAQRMWDKLVSKSTDAIYRMEKWGIQADVEAIQSFIGFLDAQLKVVESRLERYGKVDYSSAPQVGKLLFETLNLKSSETTKTGRPATDKDSLKKLVSLHPVVADILEWRKLAKLKSNFGVSLIQCIRADGRIHAEVKIDGTRTGRASVVNPPLHTLPTRDSVAKLIKCAFVAPWDHFFVAFDYSQIEIRVAAMMSGDVRMIELLKSGVDFHFGTAQLVAPKFWDIPADKVGPKQRSDCKEINFGLLYNMTDQGLAKRLGCSVEEARKLRMAILGEFVQLAKWCRENLEYTKRTGFTWTWWDGEVARLRPLFGVGSDDRAIRISAENGATNTRVQGCLPASTRILTHNGYERIGSAGREGLAWTGMHWVPYTKLERGLCELAELEFQNGQILRCDTRHEVLVAGERAYEFRKFEDLKEGDRVCFSRPQPLEFGRHTLSPDAAYWLGYIATRGRRNGESFEVAFVERQDREDPSSLSSKYSSFLADHGWTWTKQTEVTQRRSRRRVSTWKPSERWVIRSKVIIKTSNINFLEQLSKWGLSEDDDRKVPDVAWTLTLPLRKQFALGVIAAVGDSWKRGEPTRSMTFSGGRIAAELQIFLRTIGLGCVFNRFGRCRLSFLLTDAGECGIGPPQEVLRWPNDQAPPWVIETILAQQELVPRLPAGPRTMRAKREFLLGLQKPPVSQRARLKWFRRFRGASVQMVAQFAERHGMTVELYATSPLVAIRKLGIFEPTFTLSVDNPGHRFDSEGVISKNTAFDFSLASIISVIDWIDRESVPAKLVLTIHDAIYLEAHRSVVVETVRMVSQIMTGFNSLGVPLKVDVSWGKTLGSLKPWKDSADFEATAQL